MKGIRAFQANEAAEFVDWYSTHDVQGGVLVVSSMIDGLEKALVAFPDSDERRQATTHIEELRKLIKAMEQKSK